jgi:hypothetical protein
MARLNGDESAQASGSERLIRLCWAGETDHNPLPIPPGMGGNFRSRALAWISVPIAAGTRRPFLARH